MASLWHHGPSQIWWSASHDGKLLNLCACQLFSNSLACWRISFIGQTQNLTVCTVVKSISTWSPSPGPNSLTFTGVWQWQWTAGGLSWAFSKRNMSRQSYVCFCQPSPTGNLYICSEQTKHRARMISSHATIWWWFAAFWEHSLQKHMHCLSNSRCESLSYVKWCMYATAPSFPPAEGTGSRPQWLPSSRPMCLIN
jgi:hypothetical protein